jgi:DtxR family Mn-dependent transcriptional regulator
MHAVMRESPLTRSVEDYLKAIYHLSSQGGFASTSDIAAHLDVSAPSVSGMVKRLSETGLIEHVPDRGVQLTAQGRRAALKMIRRHRILEVYLVQRLRYDWDGVHDEAERLEHAVSDELIERMSLALGEPRYDPTALPSPPLRARSRRRISSPSPTHRWASRSSCARSALRTRRACATSRNRG